jgi:hypothetical protein
MRPNSATRPEYLAAFTELVQGIAVPLGVLPRRSYVGNLDTLKGSINLACRIVEDAEQRSRF